MTFYDSAITDVAGSVPSIEVWSNCLQSLKPGAHLLAFCSTANHHRNTANIEDAGFEVRDSIAWVFEGEGLSIHPDLNLIAMARKPLDCNTVASNVLKWGTGALNIDGCRIGYSPNDHVMKYEGYQNGNYKSKYENGTSYKHGTKVQINSQGRWPANLIHDGSDEVVELFPETGSGNGKGAYCYSGREYNNKETSMFNGDKPQAPSNFNDSGSAARFFFQAGPDGPRPPALIAYLHRLITPPGGTAYDPVGTLSNLLNKIQGP